LSFYIQYYTAYAACSIHLSRTANRDNLRTLQDKLVIFNCFSCFWRSH